MTFKLLTEHHLEFLSLKGGCTGSTESTLVNMPHCWKSRHCSNMDASSIDFILSRKHSKGADQIEEKMGWLVCTFVHKPHTTKQHSGNPKILTVCIHG